MSKHFSLTSWVLRLPSAKSCIHSTRNKYYNESWGDEGHEYEVRVGELLYYALAEDLDGQHCPYPMLPEWAKRLFRGRLWLSLKLTGGRTERKFGPFKFRVPTRGWNWYFHCPSCNFSSFYTFRSHRCDKCGWFFDADLRPVSRRYAFPLVHSAYMGAGEWEFRRPERAPATLYTPGEPDDIPF
jgi:hypothetical protein